MKDVEAGISCKAPEPDEPGRKWMGGLIRNSKISIIIIITQVISILYGYCTRSQFGADSCHSDSSRASPCNFSRFSGHVTFDRNWSADR